MSSTEAQPLVLASGSPRRRDLLAGAGIAFEARPAEIDERAAAGEAPEDLARRLAREKALAVARQLEAGRAVLGADTIVVLDGEVFGKPADAEEAVQMLVRLTGRTHVVTTAVALVASASLRVQEIAVHSHVQMRPADEHEIRRYVSLGESLDKAGAYALQGAGRRFVTAVEGSKTNVIGLPLDETLALLADSEEDHRGE